MLWLLKPAEQAAAASERQAKWKVSQATTLLEREALERPSKKARSCADLNRAIQKIVYDNLRSLSSDELHSVTKGGLTCWDRLTRDKPLHDLGQLCMSKNYYRDLRKMYTGRGDDDDDDDDELQVLDKGEAVDEKLLEGIVEREEAQL